MVSLCYHANVERDEDHSKARKRTKPIARSPIVISPIVISHASFAVPGLRNEDGAVSPEEAYADAYQHTLRASSQARYGLSTPRSEGQWLRARDLDRARWATRGPVRSAPGARLPAVPADSLGESPASNPNLST